MRATDTKKKPLQGQMGLKSSPLNPSSGKLVSQHLVIDHMNAHYKKLLNAKSTVDTSVPNAYVKSQLTRDREARKQMLNEGRKNSKRPATSREARGQMSKSAHFSPVRPGSARYAVGPDPNFSMDDIDYDGLSQDEINVINAMVSETIDSERLQRVLNGKASAQSGSGSTGRRASQAMVEGMAMDTSRRKKISGDIMEKRNHVFTSSHDFTPRLVKNSKYKNVPSKLSQSNLFRPAPQRLPSKHKQRPYAASASESEMLDETLMSRDFTTRLNVAGSVPKLDISIDQDHLKWLQEQSARHESSDFSALEKELYMESEKTSHPKKSLTMQRIEKEEEELSYLDFIADVTNDVLTRGIFTNRVLNKVFEEHVQKNKYGLAQSRMRSMLDNLREDLGIESEEDHDHPFDVGMGSARPPVRSKTKTTGYTGDISQFKNVKLGQATSTKANDNLNSTFPTTTKTDERFPDGDNLLADIAELSEKSASVVSSKKSVAKPNNDLIGLLGLDDVAAKSESLGLEKGSIKSLGSNLSSEKSKKSIHSNEQRHPTAENINMSDEKYGGGSTPGQLSKTNSQVSLGDNNMDEGAAGSESNDRSQDNKDATLKNDSDGASGKSDGNGEQDDQDELESNLDFGKTTIFGKTGKMDLTYKALSQASDEGENNSNDEEHF